ncbi:CKLF-like MARVEL transmembrane domain-containing protein 1 [Tamandua tetradactyla]|uniref:CKLF-like MARVEL transmembrane domain-containing protein 1 n=1 Tax=Tamandua tetradactyla TaxID=48850 RepID=UPI004054188C
MVLQYTTGAPNAQESTQPLTPQPPQPSAPPGPAERPLGSVHPVQKVRPVSSRRSDRQSRPVRSERSALKAHRGQSVSSVKSSRSTASGRPRTRPGSRAPSTPHPPKTAKEDIKKRAEERAKVPDRYRDSVKHFFFSPTGMLKILRLGLLIGALACFIIIQAHESYIAITVLEICIVLFFILIYMVTLHHLLTCLHWPLLDLINSFITAVFLLIVAILAMQERKRRHLFFVGGCLCLTATIVCLLDALMVTKKMRTSVKRLLEVRFKTSGSQKQASLRERAGMHVSLPPETQEGHR